jgi:acyl-coenzyme A thioesterase PaaI-like protein
MRRALTTLTVLAAAALLSEAPAAACAVCFGAGNNPNFVRAITLGIVVLLATVFSLLTALITAVWRIEKRRALSEAAANPVPLRGTP